MYSKGSSPSSRLQQENLTFYSLLHGPPPYHIAVHIKGTNICVCVCVYLSIVCACTCQLGSLDSSVGRASVWSTECLGFESHLRQLSFFNFPFASGVCLSFFLSFFFSIASCIYVCIYMYIITGKTVNFNYCIRKDKL